ncbi:MAG: hypothetical protein AAFR42_15275 [Cyanobacteria bacterium J06628_6]
MDTWRNRFNNICQSLWHYLNQPLFERDARSIFRWPEPLPERAQRECVQWLEECWQLDLPEHAEAVQFLERCWQRRCTSVKQG